MTAGEAVEIIHGAEDDGSTRAAGGGEGAGRRDPVHHPAAVKRTSRIDVLGEHQLHRLKPRLCDAWQPDLLTRLRLW